MESSSSSITLLVVAVVAVLMFVKFWKFVVSAAILVGVVYICALIFAGYKPEGSTSSQPAVVCYTPGGIVTQCP